MDSNFSEKPPDEHVFDLERCKTAQLVCHTLFEVAWIMNIGFIVRNTFYQTNELHGFSSEWIHDEKKFCLKSHLAHNNDDILTTIFKYESILRLNLFVKNCYTFGGGSNNYEVEAIFAAKHAPTFFYRIWNPQKQQYDYGRFYNQYYQNNTNPFWNHLINATAFKITYKMNKIQFYSWLRRLIDCLPCAISYSKMSHLQYLGRGYSSTMRSLYSRLPQKAKFYIACIRKLGTIGQFVLDYFLLKKYGMEILEDLERRHQWDAIINYFASLFKLLKKDITMASVNFDFNPNQLSANQNLVNKYVTIKSAIVTPTRILFDEMDMADCRGFRILGNNRIMIVKFVDEDGMNFPRDENILIDVMRECLLNGIQVAETQYFEFASSSSLFKQHGSFFLEANSKQTIINKINEIGAFKIEQSAKVASRLGLLFSSATEIKKKLHINEIGRLPDHLSSPKYFDEPQYTFTDGVGVIDESYANEISAELGLPYTPCAFQFRCLGCKGIVAIDKSNKMMASNGGTYKLMFRESQIKFDAFFDTDIDFDVIKYAAAAPLKLHKSLIALLAALAHDQNQREVVEKRIHELVTQAIVGIVESLYEPTAFQKALKLMPKHFPLDVFTPEQLIQQKLLRSMVEVRAVNLCKQMSSKCQIPIPETLGRQVLGTIDETGLLQEDEVYIRLSNEINSKASNPSTTILTGRVGVTKSPMYHMGDIRYLKAVDIPQLHHHLNVIVFSRRGNRPITDQIAGGDLDGDEYCIFWDSAFLMNHCEPAHFPSPDTSNLEKVTINQLHQSHTDFRLEYESKNNLERLSNIFVNLLSLHHPNHPEVKKISESADTAVNSFKSGIFADPIRPEQKPIFNANFCNKRFEPMFDCDHILSQIYKRMIRIYLLFQIHQSAAEKERRRTTENEIQVSRCATEMYKRYGDDISELMNKYNIKSESELFAGISLEPLGTFNAYKPKTNEEKENMVQQSLKNIISKYRSEILTLFKNDWENDMIEREKNLTTYYIMPYEVPAQMKYLADEFMSLSEKDGKYLSFPYLIIEGFNQNNAYNGPVPNEIEEMIFDFNNISYDTKESLISEETIKIEERLIHLAFATTSEFEKEIKYPCFTISIPHFYSNQFRNNFHLLKDLTGCKEIAIRLKKEGLKYHHYVISSQGTMKSCQMLETLLTPYLTYDHSSRISLLEMRKIKTRKMQEILEQIFGFRPPLPRHHRGNN